MCLSIAQISFETVSELVSRKKNYMCEEMHNVKYLGNINNSRWTRRDDDVMCVFGRHKTVRKDALFW
jgi:hypothetical protein